jgi:membrane protein required for colicin V production
MEDLPVNLIDILVAVIIVISAFLAFARGVAREVLGIGAWIGAGVATFFGFPYGRPIARDLIPSSDLIADVVAGLAIFVVVLVILTVINQLIAGRIQRSRGGALDRTLGFIFGVVRGAVLICLAYMLFGSFVQEDEWPAWVDEAKTMPYIRQGVTAIREVVPEDVADEGTKRIEETFEDGRERGVRELTEPVPAERPAEEGEPGYSDRERRQLEGLSESVDE